MTDENPVQPLTGLDLFVSRLLTSLEDDAPPFPVGETTALFPSVFAEEDFVELTTSLDLYGLQYVDFGVTSAGDFAMTFPDIYDAMAAKLAY